MSVLCENGPGQSGWYNFPEDPAEDLKCGCGLVYDCCGVIVPIGCLSEKCMLWDSKEGICKFAPALKQSNVPPFPPEYYYLHEFLSGGKDLDGNGQAYGYDFIVENPPPMISQIPFVGREKEDDEKE